MDCNQVPRRLPGRETRAPDDYELFLEGVLEAPRGQRKVWNGRCYNAPYKCDPTIAGWPCIGNLCTGPAGVGMGNCGPAGCAVPGARPVGIAAGMPEAPPAVGSGAPATLPPIPSAPVKSGLETEARGRSTIPGSPVVIPPVEGPDDLK